MKREERRLRLARRQAMLAEVRQRAAMRGFAEALAEENRGAALARRSRALAENYSGRAGLSDAESLHQAVAFTGALASLACDAETARDDAQQQAAWQAQALGEAQTRARRQSERLEEALSAYRSAREQREGDPALAKSSRAHAGLAQLVQSEAQGKPQDLSRRSGSKTSPQKRTAP